MAESILKLRVDSQEYDSKIKRAAEGLQQYAEGCRKAGGTLTQLDDGVLEFTRSLGNMETVSRSARGSVSEMTKAFTELSVQYNKLTDEEKNSPFGKALAQSLDTLKGRIQDGNAELKNISGSLNDTGGFLDQLSSKFTINIDALKLFNAGVTAAKAALDVAKDAFFASETNVDEWGRTVTAAESIYDSFLQTLNTGDFSGFLQRLGEVISKAHEAYNALDELQTRMTIINPERTRLQARATELKAIIRRNGADSKEGKAAQTELKQLEGMLTQAFKTESQLNMNAFKAQVDKKLQEAGIKLGKRDYDFLMRTFSSDASYMAMRRGASGSVQMNYEAGGSYDEGAVSKVDTRNINQRLLDLFTDEWRKEYAPLLNAAFSARGGAANTMLGDARYLKGGGGSGGGGGRSVGTGSVFDISNISFNPDDVLKSGDYKAVPSVWEQFGKEIGQSLMDGIEDPMSNLQVDDFIKSYQAVEDHINDMNNALAQQKMAYNMAGQAAQNFGAAMASIKNPAAQAAGTVVQAIASIALGFAMASSNANTAGTGWGWLAWLAAGMGAMATTISTIHSLTGYAEGGMIKGNSYSGDNVGGIVDGSHLVGLNAGEIVLNQAGQSNVAHALQGGAMGGMRLSARLDGKDLLLSIDRTGKEMGYGELVFFH